MTTEIKYHTKEEAVVVATKNGYSWVQYPSEPQNNEEVVMAAIKENSQAFECASDDLKSNKVFIMKALNEGVDPWYLIQLSNNNIQSDTEVMTLAVEKSNNGFEFACAKGETSKNKELAAKALVKWFAQWDSALTLWNTLHPTLQEFFPKDCWHEKAKTYLIHLNHQKEQAELVSGGTKEEDGVVW